MWLWTPTAGQLGKLNLMGGSEDLSAHTSTGLAENHMGHLAWKGPLLRLTSLLTARHSKACHPSTAGSADELSPVNYSLDNRFWTNKNKCPKLRFSFIVQKALQNSTEPQGHCF